MARITRALAVLALIAPGAAACAAGEQDTPVAADGSRRIWVEPRVVMDGLVALAQRADRVVVDEVLFHAPTVTQRAGDHVIADVLGSDAKNASPLLFRYQVSSEDGFGDVLGGERHWTISGRQDGGSRGDLVFGFEPFSQGDALLERLEGETGVDLHELSGHTAVVHGYVLSQAAPTTSHSPNTLTGFANQEQGKKADGDPDGNPADGDPDGNPAHPKTGQDGDPDGNPAHPGGDKQDGDPDGNPSTGTDGHGSGKHLDHGFSNGGAVGVHEQGSWTPTPFFLVLNETFGLRVPVDGVFDDVIGLDQEQPIDLHVALDELLTDELLKSMDEQAKDGVRGAIVVEVPDAHQAVGIDVQGSAVTRVRQHVASGGGIRVVGDAR